MTITPIGNRILVQISKKSQTSKSGIIIAADSKDEQTLGKVIAIGAGFGEDKELLDSVKVGDMVLFSSYSGQEIKDEQNDNLAYKVIEIKNVAAVVVK